MKNIILVLAALLLIVACKQPAYAQDSNANIVVGIELFYDSNLDGNMDADDPRATEYPVTIKIVTDEDQTITKSGVTNSKGIFSVAVDSADCLCHVTNFWDNRSIGKIVYPDETVYITYGKALGKNKVYFPFVILEVQPRQ